MRTKAKCLKCKHIQLVSEFDMRYWWQCCVCNKYNPGGARMNDEIKSRGSSYA